MIEHTPGPWKIGNIRPGDKVIRIEPDAAIVDYDDVNQDEAQANAYLIAAAPDMLDSLHELVAGLYAVGITMPRIKAATADALDRARVAIAKAEGETNE